MWNFSGPWSVSELFWEIKIVDMYRCHLYWLVPCVPDSCTGVRACAHVHISPVCWRWSGSVVWCQTSHSCVWADCSQYQPDDLLVSGSSHVAGHQLFSRIFLVLLLHVRFYHSGERLQSPSSKRLVECVDCNITVSCHVDRLDVHFTPLRRNLRLITCSHGPLLPVMRPSWYVVSKKTWLCSVYLSQVG